VQNAAADGYLRKISILNFEAQLILSNISGQVVDAQVPVSAVNQYRSTILNNSALTGAATAVTQASGDNTALLATTAFVQSAILSGPTRSWQDVTISRALGTTFTNASGTTIQVLIVVSSTGAKRFMSSYPRRN